MEEVSRRFFELDKENKQFKEQLREDVKRMEEEIERGKSISHYSLKKSFKICSIPYQVEVSEVIREKGNMNKI